MTEREILSLQFEASRRHLRSVALRMLGSEAEADDAVQETWLRLLRNDASAIGNLTGWLTTIVSRICLDMLRWRKSRSEVPLDAHVEALASSDDPERENLVADSIGVALLVVLETLTPAERVAFVLHDVFAVPFEAIAQVLGRSPLAARQLASRARHRVRGGSATHEADRSRQREVVAAFLAASQSGDLQALLAILDPDVVLRADAAAVEASRSNTAMPQFAPEIHGQESIATLFRNRARIAKLAVVDGGFGLVFAPAGRVRMVVDFVIERMRIVEIAMIANAESIAALDIDCIPALPSR